MTGNAYRVSILAGLSAGLSGVFAWGFDHGGFSGEIPTPELYLRTGSSATSTSSTTPGWTPDV